MQKSKLLTLILLSVFYAQYVVAQTSLFTILGQVQNRNGIAISDCPIALWRSSDSTLISTKLPDAEGRFVFTDLPAMDYTVNLGNLQYKKTTIEVQLIDKDIDLSPIILDEYIIELDEVVIAQRRPLIKLRPGEVHYSVNADPLAKNSSLYQILQRMPLVSQSNGSILIKGNIAPTYFINGIPAPHLNGNPQEALKAMRADQIKEIQLITNPEAKYDGDFSGGIINIITKRDFEAHFTGSIGSTINTRNQYSGTGSIAFRLGNVTLQGNLTSGNQKGYKERWELERTSHNNPLNYYFQQEKEREYNRNSNTIASTLLTWEPNLNNLIIFGYDYLKLDTRGVGTQMHSMYTQDNLLNYQYGIQEQSKTIYKSTDVYANYQHKWGKDGLLLIMYQYKDLPKIEDNIYLANCIINYQSYNQRFEQTTKNIEHTLQEDITYSWADTHTINGGIKGILRINNNDSQLQIRKDEERDWIQKKDDNDLFSHKQYILGFYAEYQLKKDSWDIRMGLRDEWTKEHIAYKLSPDKDFYTQFNNWLLTFRASYSFSPTNSINLYYRSNISRPSIQHLNPRASIHDPSYFYIGNPNLKSEKHHTWSSDWSIYNNKGLLNLGVTYRYSHNAIQADYGILPNGGMYRSYSNKGRYNEGGLSIFSSYNFSNIVSASLNGNVSYRSVYGMLGGKEVSQKGCSGGISTSLTLLFPKGYYLNFYGGYNFPSITLEGTGYNFYHCGSTLSKSFYKDRLSISFTAIDFLWNSKRYRRTYKTPDFQSTAYYQNYGVLFELGLTYKFNSNNIKPKKASKKIQNRDVLNFGD